MKFQHLLFAVVLLSLSTVLAKEVWQSKHYAEWTQEEAVAILTDSPWAVRQSVRGGGAGLDLSRSSSTQPEGSGPAQREGSGSARPEVSGSSVESTMGTMDTDPASRRRFYTVRIVSAKPVQMAIARWAVLEGTITPSQAQAMLSQNPYRGSVVVSMSASNEQDWSELNSFSSKALKEVNYLLLKQSKRKIFAERYVPPVESGLGDALFYFSGDDGGATLITSTEKEVSFNCRLSDRTRFRTKFKLKKMIVDGELAI